MNATTPAERLYREGRLSDAIAALGNALKEDPGDVRNRIFLFELLCFAGAYDRASKQLAALASADAEAVISTAWYQEALLAQLQRQEMFESGQLPDAGAAPPVSGTLNGKPFDDLRDGDPRIGARMEAIVGGRYTWFPFRHLERVEVKPPERLRDLFWAPAEIETTDDLAGYSGDVLLPVMTPFAWKHPDDNVRLGRMTDWVELENGDEAPEGQKIWLVDGEDIPILEVRSLVINPASDAA
jgi:type VI secretion system protein ImpE